MATVTVSAHIRWSTSDLDTGKKENKSLIWGAANLLTGKKQNKAEHMSNLIKVGGYGPPNQAWGG